MIVITVEVRLDTVTAEKLCVEVDNDGLCSESMYTAYVVVATAICHIVAPDIRINVNSWLGEAYVHEIASKR
jgi:hypothetical protein